MTSWTGASVALIGAYVLGCLSTGYYLVRAIKGVDIRTQGSGNAGARNVGRVLGKAGFVLTALGDAVKAAVAIWAVHRFLHDEYITALALLAVTAGHIWPVQLRFRGGKDVATSLGGLCIHDLRLAAAYLALFAAGLMLVRKPMLPGLAAFVGLPAVAVWLNCNWFQISALIVLAALIVCAHRANLREEFSALTTHRTSGRKPGSIDL